MRKSDPAVTCEQPDWRSTKRGQRCGQTCVDEESGKRRFRWVSGQACGEKPRTRPEDVVEFSSDGSDSGMVLFDSAGALAGLLGVPVERLEPMPLVPLAGLTGGDEQHHDE